MSAAAAEKIEISVDDTPLRDAVATMFDCGGVQVPPWQALVASLASVRPASVGAAIDWLVAHRGELEGAYAEGVRGPLSLPYLPAELQFERELGSLDRPKNDHVLRERYLFADFVGQRTWFQAVVYAIAGIEIGERDSRLLEEFGLANIIVDRRAWPMAVTRRVAGRGAGFAAAAIAGGAVMESPMLAGGAAEGCARFLHTCAAAQDRGIAVAETVAGILARKERVMGFGRPLVGPDERVPIMDATLARFGRADGRHVTILREADAAFAAQKGLRTTSAAWAAALLTDLGLDPVAVHAVSNYWITLCLYAQATFSGAPR
jgi:hypothetical protein